MPSVAIDLNADLGEGAGFDEALLGIVTSANVACGGHAGSEEIAATTAAAAAARGVAIGAHPGHADRENFGRVALPITPGELDTLLREQIALLDRATDRAGVRHSRHLKLHGALYHQVADDPALAEAAVAVAAEIGLAILGPPASVLLQAAGAIGLPAVGEGFVDRGYRLDGGVPRLIPRSESGAILEPDDAVRQAVLLATTGTVEGPSGAPVAVPVGSLCVHGDTPGAVEIAARVREALERAGVHVRAFVA